MWFTGNLSTCTVLTGLYAGFWILTGCYPLYRTIGICHVAVNTSLRYMTKYIQGLWPVKFEARTLTHCTQADYEDIKQ